MVPLIDGTNRYREWYAAERERFPLFHTPWWLDAVLGPDQWQAIGLADKQGDPLVFMPITYRKKWGLTMVDKPPLTPYLGPLWSRPLSDIAEMDTLAQLVTLLPKPWYFRATLRPEAAAGLPFSWAGYRLTTRYTYRIEISNPNELFSAANRNARRNLQKGADQYTVTPEWKPALLHAHLRAVFHRQDQPVPIRLVLLERLATALAPRDRGHLLVARDSEGTAQGTLLTAWDQDTYYLIATGATPAGRRDGAFYALLHSLPGFIPAQCQILDFCGGSRLPGVARRNLGLGAVGVVYLEVKKLC